MRVDSGSGGWGMSVLAGIARGVVAGALVIGALTGVAFAQATPLTVTQGRIDLPTSGLRIEAPAAPNIAYKVSGSWAFNAETNAFDTRDVVDESNTSTNTLVAGNWILIGYFDAGDCNAVVRDVNLDGGSTSQQTVWGMTWTVRTGVYTFDGALDRKPAAVLCATDSAGRSLLLYRFVLDRGETLPDADIMSSVRGSTILERSAAAWRDNIAADLQPLRRTEVRNRGTSPAARKVTLPVSGLTFDIPDDGYFWLAETEAEEGAETDMIYRLLPSTPEVTLDIVAAEGLGCPDLLALLPLDRPTHRASDLPANWTSGGSLLVDGETELVACRTMDYGALVVGVFQGEQRTSLSWAHPMLNALAHGTLAN